MTPSLPPEAPVVALLDAGLLLAALPAARRFGFAVPTAAAVLNAAGAGRSRAYEVKGLIEAAIPALLRPPGRPPLPAAAPTLRPDLTGAALDYVYDHPGSVEGVGARRRYSDGFRRFVLELAAAHPESSLPDLAASIRIPHTTLKDWLRGGVETTRHEENLATTAALEPTGPQVEQLLALHAAWGGSFVAFCRHANEDWRLPFGRTLIASILEVNGVRHAKRRPGRSPDEDGLRGSFETFFPNAQWVGDGALIRVGYGDESFGFNLQLTVDPDSGAFVGAAVTDTEDAASVIASVRDATLATAATPLSVLLDNKPSNHADVVKEAVAPAVVERATPYRPQNKAHVEGAFGLFRQVAPALVLIPGIPREVARQLVIAVVTTWARTLNHRPRADRGGRSRVELHLDHVPTPEEIAAARAALHERMRRQERLRATTAARQDPVVRQALAEAFTRLGFEDPDGELLNAIARYPLGHVLDGIAIVEGKRRAGTLPDGVDARYLLVVVCNVSEEHEGYEIALAIWNNRQRARDQALAAAERDREALDEEINDVHGRVAAYVDHALQSARTIDRFFWLTATADTILEQELGDHRPLFLLAARRIHATRAVKHLERLSATRFLAGRILPVA